ncbi:MAG TPA: UvrD-helicase domain-containing protein [Thermoanaerobaculia bacterium]|nr:UvrD-helicase domain-containing protein [Thermoanaerobaculia bacterium]
MVARPEDLLEGLNPEQAAAVSHGEGPLLVLAGAGSGKTRVLTRRLAWVVAHGVPQEAVVAVTFTNKAAGEMKDRVGALLGTERPRSFVGTFHAWGVRLLRRFPDEAGVPRGFVVFDSDDQLAVVKRAMKEVALPEKSATPRQLQARISQAKNEGIQPDDFPQRFGDFLGSRLADIARAYEKSLRASKALDFDDLLLLSTRLVAAHDDVRGLLRRSIRHLLVDEYQDTNRVQAKLVRLIAGEAGNLFVVGDEDQSIYRWRGADVSNILEFAREFPSAKTVRLERNYRSTAPILKAAGAVVAENRRRLGKKLKATKTGGENVRLAVFDEERDEAKEIVSRIAAARRARPRSEVAVLFRTNAQSRPFEDELLRSNLPYVLVGGTKFYERAEIKDALAYLRLAHNPADDVSFRRVVNVPARGVGAATLEALEAEAAEHGVSLLGALDAVPMHLTERAKKALTEFRRLVERLHAFGAAEGNGAGATVALALEETGLSKLYENSLDPQDEARRENLDELLAAAREHERATSFGGEGDDPSVAGFLDAVTLRSDADEADERKGILLITLHAAKGLEFDDVFLAGFEDGSLPHASSKGDEDQFEEERRLAYVGMTRAKERLTLSYVLRRMVRGEWISREPSPFLSAIPESVLEREDLTSGFGRRRTGDFLEREEGNPRGPGGRSSFGRGGGSLFPDYENESQEPGASPSYPSKKSPSPSSRFPARNLSPVRSYMKRTPPPPTASGFRRGSKVRHPDYGPGVVLTIEGSGDAEKVIVYFDSAGRKKFVARFANLTPG